MTENLPKTQEGVIGEVARISELGPFKLLLNRSFSAIGDYVGEHVEGFIGKLKEKRGENIRAHVQAVRKVDNPDPEPTIHHQQLVFQWAEKAQDVDPKEEALSAFWRVTLEAIDKDDPLAAQCLKAVSELDASDILALVAAVSRQGLFKSWFVGRPIITSAQREKFIRLGLMFRWYERLPLGLFTVVIGLPAGTLLGLAAPDFSQASRVTRLIVATSLVVFAVSFLVAIFSMPGLTPLGSYLLRTGEKYMPNLRKRALRSAHLTDPG